MLVPALLYLHTDSCCSNNQLLFRPTFLLSGHVAIISRDIPLKLKPRNNVEDYDVDSDEYRM